MHLTFTPFRSWNTQRHTVRVMLAVLTSAVLFAVLLVTGTAQEARAQILPGGTCVNDVTGRENNCTANDMRIASVELLPDSPDIVRVLDRVLPP